MSHDAFTCLSSGAVGADHLSCGCDSHAAALVWARARLTIPRRANQGVSIVTLQAALAGPARGEVRAFAHACNKDSDTERLVSSLCTPEEVQQMR